MADAKISALTGASTPVAGTEVLPIVQSGSTKKVSIDNLTKGRTVNAATFDTDVAAAGVTLSGVTLAADGTDANIDINVTPKGTGVVNATRTSSEAYRLAAAGVITDATTARTLSASDNGKVIYFTSGSAIQVDTASGLGAGFSCVLIQGGAGQITVAQGAGTTRVAYASMFKTAGQYATASLFCPVADTFVLSGNLTP